MSDKIINCLDCGNEFVWTSADQDWYKQRGLLAPKRCRDCRAIKRAKYNAGTNNK